MSELEAPPAAPAPSRSYLPMIIVAIVLLLVGVAVLAYISKDKIPGLGGPSGAIKHVGCIDQEAIFSAPDFEAAKKEIETKAKDQDKKVKEIVEKLGSKPSPEEQKAAENKVREMRLAFQQESNKKLNPLKLRAEYAVSQVARDKGISVVLDKRIIVYGVPDITEDVKKAFASAKEGDKVKDDPNSASAPIGYFDQEVVRTLKVFQQAELNIYQERGKLAKEFEEKTKNMSPSDKELLERQYRLKAEAFQEQTMTPLIQAVNDAVKEVAQAEGLSLVLDKQHVMQGGRNMTDKVVEAFLKKVGTPGAAATPGTPATPGNSTPTPAETPAGGH